MFRAIINAGQVAITTFFNFVPHFIGFLAIAFVGWLVGMAFDKVVTLLLRKIGFARLSDRFGLTHMLQSMGIKADSSKILGRVVFWFIFLIFLIPAADALGVPTISNTLNIILDYMPNVFVAILALILGVIIGKFAGDMAHNASEASNVGSPRMVGGVVRYAIIGFACLIALEQLKIAPPLITALFAAVMGGLALAFGLSFGLGGREHASRLLSRSESSMLARRPYDPGQIVQQARSDLTHSEQMGQQYAPPEVSQPGSYGEARGQHPVPHGPQDYPNPINPNNPRNPRNPNP